MCFFKLDSILLLKHLPLYEYVHDADTLFLFQNFLLAIERTSTLLVRQSWTLLYI